MKEVLTTSSALILALLGLRLAFRKSISRRVQYALWALVLARLLVPVNLPAADFSVLTAAAPVIGAEEDQTLYLQPVLQTISAPEDSSPLLAAPSDARFAAMGPPSSDNTRTVTDENQVTRQTKYRRQIDLGAVLRPIWYGGMAVMVLWLAGSNLRFRRFRWNLKKVLEGLPLGVADCSVEFVLGFLTMLYNHVIVSTLGEESLPIWWRRGWCPRASSGCSGPPST